MNFISIIKSYGDRGVTEMIVDKEVRRSLYHFCHNQYEDVYGFWYSFCTIEVGRQGKPYNSIVTPTSEYQFPYNLLPDESYFKYIDYHQGWNFYNVYFKEHNRKKIETILLLDGFIIS